jgi:hypothetical protein
VNVRLESILPKRNRPVFVWVLLLSVWASIFTATGGETLDPVVVGYVHGAAVHAGVSKADQDIASWFAVLISGDPEDGAALGVDTHTFHGLPTGSIEKRDVLEVQSLYALRLPEGGTLVSVGYSAGGGALWDLTAGRNIEDNIAVLRRQYQSLMEGKGLHHTLVLIDPFTRVAGWGWVPGVAQAQPMTEDDMEAIGAFLEQGNAILAIHFGGYGPWHGISVVQNATDGTYREMERTWTYLERLPGEPGSDLRLTLLGPESDVSTFWNGPNPLGDLDHKSFSQAERRCLAFIQKAIEWFELLDR